MQNSQRAIRNSQVAGLKAQFPIVPCALCILCALCLLLVGCGSGKTTITQPDGTAFTVDRARLKSLDAWLEAEETKGVPVEALLWQAGYPLVERVVAVEADGVRHQYRWADVAEEAEWLLDGKLSIAGETYRATSLEVTTPAVLSQVQASITDLAPTAAAALGLPAPASATGRLLEADKAGHVLLMLLDGLGYEWYEKAREAGDTPELAALGEPLMALTTFPPITTVSMASLLTGAPPKVHGVEVRGERKTEAQTLFGVVSEAGRSGVAIEGESLPFNLPNATLRLSGDRDGNGSTDDNVLANTLAVIEAGMPDLLFVHFHGIDDTGHTYGPGSAEQLATIREVDAAVKEVIGALPQDTLVLIVADHGQHRVDEEGALGNHGHLIEEDMLIPIWITKK